MARIARARRDAADTRAEVAALSERIAGHEDLVAGKDAEIAALTERIEGLQAELDKRPARRGSSR